MKLTKNFSLKEFGDVPDEYIPNIQELANNLQVVRDFFDAPIKVTSGYRSPEHNKSTGGAKNSQHLLGKAADFKVKGIPPEVVTATIAALIRIGAIKEGGIGLYKTWTHYDTRGTKARWRK